MGYRSVFGFLLMLACCFFSVKLIAQQGYHKSVIEQGIRVDVSLTHIAGGKPVDEFREGEDVRVQFKISDTVSGKRLSGVSLAAWMDKEKGNNNIDCGKKIKSFIEGGFLNRPELDLNAYFVLTMNDDNSINVVNPLFGFGGSQLMAQIQLPAPGYDWVIKEDQSFVFVSMPQANQVAFISTSEMKNVQDITLPGQPGKLVLQADEHYLWVTYDLPGSTEKKSGVAIIDVENKTLVKTIATGNGPHEIVIDEANKQVYISNKNGSSLSVLDMKTLAIIKDIQMPGGAQSIAFSTKSQALYVVNKKEPVISVIDGKSLQVVKKIIAEAGITKITFMPGGRNGFVINPKKNTVTIIDAATNRIVQTADVEAQPDEITFTDLLVYVRHLGTEIISMIPLEGIGREGVPVSVATFSGGQNPPAQESPECGALGIVQAPGDNSILISNYKDESVYYYQEGMAAPMGNFATYGKRPKAVLVIDRSIKEKADGEYETIAKLGTPGAYNLALFINVPLIKECFQINVLPDTLKEKQRRLASMGSLIIKFLSINTRPKVGEVVSCKFQMIDINTNQPVFGLKDINVMNVMTTQNKNDRTNAKETDIKGTYEANVLIDEEGLYYLYVECPSRGLTYNNSQYRMLFVSKSNQSK